MFKAACWVFAPPWPALGSFLLKTPRLPHDHRENLVLVMETEQRTGVTPGRCRALADVGPL